MSPVNKTPSGWLRPSFSPPRSRGGQGGLEGQGSSTEAVKLDGKFAGSPRSQLRSVRGRARRCPRRGGRRRGSAAGRCRPDPPAMARMGAELRAARGPRCRLLRAALPGALSAAPGNWKVGRAGGAVRCGAERVPPRARCLRGGGGRSEAGRGGTARRGEGRARINALRGGGRRRGGRGRREGVGSAGRASPALARQPAERRDGAPGGGQRAEEAAAPPAGGGRGQRRGGRYAGPRRVRGGAAERSGRPLCEPALAGAGGAEAELFGLSPAPSPRGT